MSVLSEEIYNQTKTAIPTGAIITAKTDTPSNETAYYFDMDGVLIDTEKYLTKFWCMAAKEFGYDMRLEHAYEIRSLAGINGANRLKEIFELPHLGHPVLLSCSCSIRI